MEKQALGTGITMESESSFYTLILAGSDNSEANNPFYLWLSHSQVQKLNKFLAEIIENKEIYDKYDKQLHCSHPEVNRLRCLRCGAMKRDFEGLLFEREARRHYASVY